MIGVGSPTGVRSGVRAIADRSWCCSRPITGPHRRLRMIDIAGGGMPKTAGGGYGGARPGKRNGHQPPDDGPGNSPPPLDAAVQSVDVAGGMGM